jgi:hypothetical protein
MDMTPPSLAISGKSFSAPRHSIESQHHISPQIDGKIEVLNKCLEAYLVLYFKETIPMGPMVTSIKWQYNTTYHGATQMTHFEVVYGQNPPSVLSYLPRVSKVKEVEKTLIIQADILHTLKDNLVMAQNRMKHKLISIVPECHFDRRGSGVPLSTTL